MLAERKRLVQAYMMLPGGEDVDVVLLDKKGRAVIAYEIKVGGFARSEAKKLYSA